MRGYKGITNLKINIKRWKKQIYTEKEDSIPFI